MLVFLLQSSSRDIGLKVAPSTHYAHLDHESLMIMTMFFILSNFMAMQIKDTWIMSRTFVQFLSFKRMTGHRMFSITPRSITARSLNHWPCLSHY